MDRPLKPTPSILPAVSPNAASLAELAHLSPASLQELAQRLLAPSREMDGQGPSFYRQAVYSLANKTELAEIIRQSMPGPAAPPVSAPNLADFSRADFAASSSSALPPNAARAAPASSAINDETARALREQMKQEYRPALADRSLIEALLELHRRGSSPRAAASAPVRGGPVGAGSRTSSSTSAHAGSRAFASPDETGQPEAAFAPARAPSIEAGPKSGRYLSKTPGVSRTILRSRDE